MSWTRSPNTRQPITLGDVEPTEEEQERQLLALERKKRRSNKDLCQMAQLAINKAQRERRFLSVGLVCWLEEIDYAASDKELNLAARSFMAGARRMLEVVHQRDLKDVVHLLLEMREEIETFFQAADEGAVKIIQGKRR